LGTPLGNGQKVAKARSDPWTANIVGYAILPAEGMDAAKKLIEGHGHRKWNGGREIEIYEAMPLPQ
jgi:hypothetical protein